MLLVIGGLLGTAGGGGAISTSFCVMPLCQQGTEHLTFNPTPGSPAVQFVTVTFPTPFTKVPTVGILNVTSITVTMDNTYFFQAGGSATTWPAMPAALTELYGNSQHEIVWEMPNEARPNCGLIVQVVNPGFAGSKLRVQYSSDLSTWANVFSDTTVSDVPIDTAGLATSLDAFDPIIPLPVPFLRVVGLGGNGIASPSFTILEFVCHFLSAYVNAVIRADFPTTKTQFRIEIDGLMIPDNPKNVDVTWIAYIS